MAFDYIYGLSSDQYSFYRIPKSLMFGDEFRDLSLQAKLLYGLRSEEHTSELQSQR